MIRRILLPLLLLGVAAACASLDSAAMSGSDMAKKNLGHTSTATKSATMDEKKEASDAEKAAEAGMKNAEETTGGDSGSDSDE